MKMLVSQMAAIGNKCGSNKMKRFGKAGQSNMFWIIIGAVLALVVMIILLLLFTGKTDTLEDGVSGCAGKGGQCESDDSCSSGTLEAPFTCPNPDDLCCIGFGNDDEDE